MKLALFTLLTFLALAAFMYLATSATRERIVLWTMKLAIPAVAAVALVGALLAIILNLNIKVI